MAKNPLAAALSKAVGSNDTIQQVNQWLSTGFKPLNKAISNSFDGGIPCGRITEIFGPSSSGKTLIATQVMISAQQAGGIAVFFDHENSFAANLAEKYGLDIGDETGQWVYKQPETFEEAIDIASSIMKVVRDGEFIASDAPIVFVFDSLASMVPRSKAEKLEKQDAIGMNDNTALARATAAHFPTLSMWCRKYNATCLFLNQTRVNLGVMFGDNITAPGGNAPEFYSSVRIRLGRSIIKDGKEKVGQSINAECIKNKVSQPNKKASWDYYYDTNIGFDIIGSSIDYLCDVGALEKSGSYITVGSKKYQRKTLIEHFRETGVDKLNTLFERIV